MTTVARMQWDDGFEKRFRKEVARAVDRGAIEVSIAMKASLSRGGASNRGNGGRASAPGKPPAVRTGTLRRSIQIDRSEVQKNLRARIGTNVKYARIHELGGTITPKNGPFLVFKVADGSYRKVKSVKMPKRPFAAPALKKARRKVLKRFNVKSLLRGATRRG